MTEWLNLHRVVCKSGANGPGVRAVVWVQGCPRSCPGCFNPATHAFGVGQHTLVSELAECICTTDGIDGVTFSGGEPFSQAAALAVLASEVHKHNLTVMCYTGYTLERLLGGRNDSWQHLLSEVDLLVDGPYVEQLHIGDTFRGSSNQRVHYLSTAMQSDGTADLQKVEYVLSPTGLLTTSGFPTH